MVERGVMDIDDCVKKMEELYADKKLREELGKNGVRKIKKYYDWEVVHPQWQKLINQMMK